MNIEVSTQQVFIKESSLNGLSRRKVQSVFELNRSHCTNNQTNNTNCRRRWRFRRSAIIHSIYIWTHRFHLNRLSTFLVGLISIPYNCLGFNRLEIFMLTTSNHCWPVHGHCCAWWDMLICNLIMKLFESKALTVPKGCEIWVMQCLWSFSCQLIFLKILQSTNLNRMYIAHYLYFPLSLSFAE